jgi:hypothetical protein
VNSLESLLDRPPADRLREWKYRCAQSFVFGLPILALQCFGYQLGGPEAGRWIGLLQTLLGGWVVYIGAVAVFVEGLLLLSQSKITLSLILSALAIALYLLSVIAWAAILLQGRPWPAAPRFDLSVTIILFWSALQWARLSRTNQ